MLLGASGQSGNKTLTQGGGNSHPIDTTPRLDPTGRGRDGSYLPPPLNVRATLIQTIE